MCTLPMPSTHHEQSTTIGSILKAYESGVALPQRIVLRCNGAILESSDTISKLNINLDKVILIEAVAQTSPNSSDSIFQREPLHARSINNVVMRTEASMDQQGPVKQTSLSDRFTHALPYNLQPPPGVDKIRLVNVMNLICKYEGTDKNALSEHLLTYGELMLLFTMVDFVHEKLAELRDLQGSNFRSFTGEFHSNWHQSVDRYHILTPNQRTIVYSF